MKVCVMRPTRESEYNRRMPRGVAFGQYRLLQRLGRGGTAEVFLAECSGPLGFQKKLAIKRIHPQHASNKVLTDLFLKEAQLAANLNHPNLVQVWGFGEIEGTFYLAMEAVDGVTMFDLLARVGRLSLGPAIRVTLDVLEGLSAIHTATDADGRPLRLVHRDVSLGNVMVTRHGTVKLLDFGLAMPANDPAAAAFGTPRSMSPEQYRGGPVDARSDIFAVAMLLYQALIGTPPFEGTPAKVPPRPPVIPGPLWACVARALEIEREKRPISAREFMLELAPFLEGRGYEATHLHLASIVRQVMPQTAPLQAASKIIRRTVTWFKDRASLVQSIGRTETGEFGASPPPPDPAEPPRRSGGPPPLPASTTAAEAAVRLASGPAQEAPALGEGQASGPTALAAEPGALSPRSATILTHPRAPVNSQPKAAATSPLRTSNEYQQALGSLAGLTSHRAAIASARRRLMALALAVVSSLALVFFVVAFTHPDTTELYLEQTLSPLLAVSAEPVPPESARLAPTEPARAASLPAPGGAAATARPPAPPADGAAAVPPPGPGHGDGVRSAVRSPPTEADLVLEEPLAEHVVLGRGEHGRVGHLKGPTGRLSVDTMPLTEVYLGGRRLGQTPLEEIRLRTGRHELTLRNAELGIVKQVSVTIRPGKLTRVHRILSAS